MGVKREGAWTQTPGGIAGYWGAEGQEQTERRLKNEAALDGQEERDPGDCHQLSAEPRLRRVNGSGAY